jgi:hypothetical protein
MSNIREVNPEDDEFGRRLIALLAEYDIKTFIFSGIDKNSAGITSMEFEDTSKGVTALALLVRAVPELFLIFEEAKLGAYVSMITSMLQQGKPPTMQKEVAEGDLLANFTVSGKLKN